MLRNNGNTGYRQPPPSVVYIGQRDPIVQMNLPQLQENYMNVNTANQESAYYQLSYFDFPESDDLLQYFGPVMKVRMHVVPELVYAQPISPTVKEVFKKTYNKELNRAEYGYSVSGSYFDLDINVNTGSTIQDIIEQIRVQLTIFSTMLNKASASLVGYDYILRKFLQNLEDIYYDQATQKICLNMKYTDVSFDQFKITDSPVLRDVQFGINLQHFIVYFYFPSSDHGNDVTLSLLNDMMKTSRSFLQAKLIKRIFGGDPDAKPVIFYDKESEKQVALPFYSEFNCNVVVNGLQLMPALQQSIMYSAINSDNAATQYTTTYLDQFKTTQTVYSNYASKLSLSDFVFLVTTANTNLIFDGKQTQLIDILPRASYASNWSTYNESGIVNLTQPIQSNLSALRTMKVYLQDENGNPIAFPRPYILKFVIYII